MIKLINTAFIMYLTLFFSASYSKGASPSGIQVPTAIIQPKIVSFLTQYVGEKAKKPKGKWVLVIRFEKNIQNEMYVCLISKKELQYTIDDNVLIPYGRSWIANVEVICLNDSEYKFIHLSNVKRYLNWYKHVRILDEHGEEIEPNVEPHIDVFEINNDFIKRIGYVISRP